MRGITLLEILLVLGILIILGAMVLAFYRNYFSEVEIEEEENRIITLLRQAKGNALSSEQNLPWGVRFVNPLSGTPYYDIFAGPNYNLSATTTRYFLPTSIIFENPPAGKYVEALFARRSATTTATSTTIRLRDNAARAKTINISAQGLISR